MKIIADLHTHTIASTHAYSTILENCRYAREYGLSAIAMTDHATNMPDSPHIWHFENLKALPRKIEDVIVLRGAEVNIIDNNGSIEFDESMTSNLEWIVASMHAPTYEPTTYENHTQAYLKVAENKAVDVIGHCTTSQFPFDMEKCVKKFKEYEKFVEINESAIMNKIGSKENTYKLLELCKKFEVPVVVDSDSHFCQTIGKTPISFKMIEELDFPESLVYNSDWEKIKAHIIKKHGDIGI